MSNTCPTTLYAAFLGDGLPAIERLAVAPVEFVDLERAQFRDPCRLRPLHSLASGQLSDRASSESSREKMCNGRGSPP